MLTNLYFEFVYFLVLVGTDTDVQDKGFEIREVLKLSLVERDGRISGLRSDSVERAEVFNGFRA